MRRILGVVLMMVCLPAFGQSPPQEKERQGEERQLQCVMFSVDSSRMQMQVIAGNLDGSGAGGNQPSDPNKKGKEASRFTVKITPQTNIHRQGAENNDKLSMEDLARLSKQQIAVPITVRYNSNDQTQDQPLTATEIIVKQRPPK